MFCRKLGAWLRSPSRRKGDRNAAASAFGLSARTLNRWKGQAAPGKIGRPAHSQQTKEAARPRIEAQLTLLGFGTGTPTLMRLLPDIPERVIAAVLRVLKAEHRAQESRRLKGQRVHVQVKATGALLAQDSTHVGSAQGRKAWAEVLKDAATCEAWAFGNGKPITAQGVLEHLETLKALGRLPLVWATDNGPAYVAAEVRAWLAREKVIHLLSRPHTPQDNGRAERGIGEGKRLAGLGKGVLLENGALGVRILDQALQTLNQHWPRNTKGGLTAAQLKRSLPHWQVTTTRATFYAVASTAIQAIKATSKRELRRETREAIFRTLEQFGLILRTRGELKNGYVKPDRIS